MARPYWWFQGASVAELQKQLTEAGADARLEVRIDAKQSMTFTVVSGDVSTQSHIAGHPINDSHICPPDCGGG